MVEFIDGSFKAQLGTPNMRHPILFALSYPERFSLDVKPLNFSEIQRLTFCEPDMETFINLKLSYQALKEGGTSSCILNAANEVSVQAFLEKKISFLEIGEVNEQCMNILQSQKVMDLDTIFEADTAARKKAEECIKKRS